MPFVCDPPTLDTVVAKQKLTKEANTAGQFAGTGVPLLDSVLSNINQSISSIANVTVNAGVSQLVTNTQDKLAGTLGPLGAAAVANITTILNLSANAKMTGYGFVIDSLQRQVTLRYALLRELQFHIAGLLSILQQLTRASSLRDLRLQQAYPFIKDGYINLSRVQTALKSSKPRFNKIVYRGVSADIDKALAILAGVPTTVTKNVRNGVSVGTAIQKYKLSDSIAQTALMTETYIWHLENLVAIPVGGFDAVGPNMTFSATNKLIQERQKQLNILKAGLYNTLQNDKGILGTLAWVDTNKGLILTNETAKVSVDVLKNYEATWKDLSTSSNALWGMLSPSLGLLQTVEEQVRTALAQGNSSSGPLAGYVNSTMLIAGVSAELTTAKQLLLAIESQGVAFDITANDYAALDAIVMYLNSAEYAKGVLALTSLLQLLVTATGLALQAPLSKGALYRAVVLFNDMSLVCRTVIKEDTALLNLLRKFHIMDKPGIAAVVKSLLALSLQGAVGSMISNSFSSGNFKQVTGLLTNVTTAVGGGVSAVTNTLSSILGTCDTVNNNAAAMGNPKALDLENVIYSNQQRSANVNAANKGIDFVRINKAKINGF